MFLNEIVREMVPAAPPAWWGSIESCDTWQVGTAAVLASVVVVDAPGLVDVVPDPPVVVVAGAVVVVDRWVVVDVEDADVAPDEHAARSTPPDTRTASTANLRADLPARRGAGCRPVTTRSLRA